MHSRNLEFQLEPKISAGAPASLPLLPPLPVLLPSPPALATLLTWRVGQ